MYQIEVFSVLLLAFMIMPWLLKSNKQFHNFKVNKSIVSLNIGIIVSSIYFGIRATLGSNDLRFFQNTFVIIQIMHTIIIIDFMKLIGYKKDDMIKLLLNLGLIQGVICILMLIFPGFRKIALNLYYLGRDENIFISRMRIYGINGDYTYFIPIYHGMLASITFFYTVFKNKKYLIYLPFLLVSILLNGRFGLAIFLLSPIAVIVYFIFKGKIPPKTMRYSFIMLMLLIIGLFFISMVSPYTYSWIIAGIKDTINLAF